MSSAKKVIEAVLKHMDQVIPVVFQSKGSILQRCLSEIVKHHSYITIFKPDVSSERKEQLGKFNH
jgi:hypothetical protein